VVIKINIGLAGIEHDTIAIEYNCPALLHNPVYAPYLELIYCKIFIFIL
jgi:hypothetical protein